MDIYTFLILNGPNLGHLGQRQPEIYGHQDLSHLEGLIRGLPGTDPGKIELLFYQSNSEGKIIDRLEQAREEAVHGLVLNAGAYTHTSLAIADCLAWIQIPCVEVHLSNVWARDGKLRHQSLMAGHCLGVVAGFGILSYALAVQALIHHLRS
ncbi:MAG: 3-dehydroquinate dehydratase [Desulfohalobiaceae bacterium]|nr:3-dehydroquinate dehydratase [Desulfohalobiaceae bacterium]